MKTILLFLLSLFTINVAAQDFFNTENLWLYKAFSTESELFYKYEMYEPQTIDGEVVYTAGRTKIEFFAQGGDRYAIRNESYYGELLFKQIGNAVYVLDQFGSGEYEFLMELGITEEQQSWELSHFGSPPCGETEFINTYHGGVWVDGGGIYFDYLVYHATDLSMPNSMVLANIGPLLGGFEICYNPCGVADACNGYPEKLIYSQDENYSYAYQWQPEFYDIDRILYGSSNSVLTSRTWILVHFEYRGQTYDPPQENITLTISPEMFTTVIENSFTGWAIMVDNAITETTLNFDEYSIDGDWPEGMAEFEFPYFSFFLMNFPVEYEITSSGEGSNSYNLVLTNSDGERAFYHAETLSTTEVNTEKPSLQIYPNPVKDILQLNSAHEIEELEIYSASGKILKALKSPAPEINVSGLPAGVYFIRAKIEGKEMYAKFIKK